jgi:2-amino-4-hydroxy-6-hydroxymethyldihydropteridine diphosphokinase
VDRYSDNFVLLSIGSNIGKKKQTILKAFELIKDSNILNNATISSFYETEPVGFKDQPWFLNAAISGYTKLSHNDLINILKTLEQILGRKPRKRWHEREIDIDILLFGNTLLETKPLTLPHPRMHERKFVLLPASEIAGEIVHPKLGLSIKTLLDNCKDSSEVYLINN